MPVSSEGVPMASLNVGALGFGPSAQTVSRNFTVLACMALAWVTACGGTPQFALLSSRNFTTFSSAAVKFCTAAHMSLRSPLRLPIAETSSAFALASSRSFGKFAQTAGGGGPPIGGPPIDGPDGKTDCCDGAGKADCCGGGGNGDDCCGAGGNGDCASAGWANVTPAAKASPIATTRLRFIAIPCGSPSPKPQTGTGYPAPVAPASLEA